MIAVPTDVLTWLIAAIAILGVITRPRRWPEAIWAVGGAGVIVLLGLLPLTDAWRAIARGSDVYLFLTGMMVLSELARQEGVFDWLADLALVHARGSRMRLFTLVYSVGTIVTIFLSNDATAVVLTPAVFAVSRKAQAPALPLLFACALIANAASFVLPISNPANLVLFGDRLPPLGAWLLRFGLSSLVAIGVTYAVLRWTQRGALAGACALPDARLPLTSGGRLAVIGIASTGIALLIASARAQPLGLATLMLATLTTFIVLLRRRTSPWPILRRISWSVLALVAGLFVLVETLHRTGVVDLLADALRRASAASMLTTASLGAVAVALGSNVVNNLPMGLLASATVAMAQPPLAVVDALLIGVDIGPNLSVTGSLATILWLTAIRRESVDVSFAAFLRIGVQVMPPALLLAVLTRLLLTS